MSWNIKEITEATYTVQRWKKNVFLLLTVQTLYGLYVSISTFDVEETSYENIHVHEYNASYSLISCARFEVLTEVLKKIKSSRNKNVSGKSVTVSPIDPESHRKSFECPL
jgi:hypothetical protein